MEHIDNVTMEYCRRLREVCLANAKALVNSAKTLEGENTAHVRFHLAALAIEEVGQAVIILLNASSATLERVDDQRRIPTDDHVKKLFWAIFSPLIEQGRLTKEYIESHRELARGIHKMRLDTLYTNPQDPLLPQDRVKEEEVCNLVKICETRIEMEKGVELSDIPDKSKLEDFHWFYTASDDQEKKRYFFGESSLDKLAELGDLFEWMKWHRQEFTKVEEESRELLQQELQKEPIDGIEGDEPKWKVRFRIKSESHSIRQRALSAWNRNYGSIMKLHSTNDSNELICEFTLSKSVHIRVLWDAALGRSRDFVAALNIATSGLFWWHVDKDIARFYEKVWDLENDDTEVRLNVSPQLRMDWGHQSLKEENLNMTQLVLGYLLKDIRSNRRKRAAIENYLTGVALLSKNDIHLRLEPNAFAYFFTAFKTLFLANDDWDGVTDFKSAAAEQLRAFFPPQNLNNYIEWGIQLENRNNPSRRITLTEVIQMKNYCDVYFYLSAERDFDKHRNLTDSSEE